MDNLFPLIVVVIGIVASLVSSSRKEKEKQAAEARRKAAVAARVQAAQQKLKESAPAQPAPTPAPLRVEQPQVHAHIQPDCAAHDAPGSLGVTSLEGKDPCHEDQLTMERTVAEVPQQEGGLTFDWSGDSMVKAVVMQEVLTRPCQRRAR